MIGRLLGIDHGLKRIGLAVSDSLGITAKEYGILENTGDDQVYVAIKAYAEEQFAVALIVGIPSNVGGSSEQADTIRAWAGPLAEHTGLKVIFWDEQLSSADARELAKGQKRKPDAPIDDLAARVILQSYLNAVADRLEPPPTTSDNL